MNDLFCLEFVCSFHILPKHSISTCATPLTTMAIGDWLDIGLGPVGVVVPHPPPFTEGNVQKAY